MPPLRAPELTGRFTDIEANSGYRLPRPARALERARLSVLDATKARDDARAVYAKAFARVQRKDASARDLEFWAKAQQALAIAQQRLDTCGERIIALEQHSNRAQHWLARYKAVHRELARTYTGIGPQYDLLVDRLAHAVVRAEQADEDGIETLASEHRSAAREVRDGVLALQRYTESTKQEILQKRIEEQVVRVLHIVEEVVQPKAPELWVEVVGAIEEKAPSLN